MIIIIFPVFFAGRLSVARRRNPRDNNNAAAPYRRLSSLTILRHCITYSGAREGLARETRDEIRARIDRPENRNVTKAFA